jgi:hypothetical protein
MEMTLEGGFTLQSDRLCLRSSPSLLSVRARVFRKYNAPPVAAIFLFAPCACAAPFAREAVPPRLAPLVYLPDRTVTRSAASANCLLAHLHRAHTSRVCGYPSHSVHCSSLEHVSILP